MGMLTDMDDNIENTAHGPLWQLSLINVGYDDRCVSQHNTPDNK